MPRRSKSVASPVVVEDGGHIGLDVHKRSIHVAVWKNDALAGAWGAGADYLPLVEKLKSFRPALRLVAYEAGPTGFALARLLEQNGFKVLVCAPSKTPQVPGGEVQCDRPDARKIAEYAAKGLLVAVTIPTEDEENERALTRHRDHLIGKIRRVKQQVKAALLFHQCGELASWSQAERGRLLASGLSAEVRFTLESLLRELAFFEAERKRVEMELASLLAQDRHAAAAQTLRTHPGVGKTVAACFMLELFRPGRFKDAAAVARYVGLAPRVRQSGETHRGGPLMRSGQGRLRALLIEAAWMWRAKDARARAIYGRLVANTGNGNKAMVGLARRLAIRRWTMWVRGEAYKPTA